MYCTAKLHFNYFDRHRCSNIGLWKLEGEFMTDAGARTLEECSVFKAKCCIGYGVLLIHRKKTFLFLFQLIATSTRWHSKDATLSLLLEAPTTCRQKGGLDLPGLPSWQHKAFREDLTSDIHGGLTCPLTHKLTLGVFLKDHGSGSQD